MSQYTLAQALRHRSKLKGQLKELTERAQASVQHQDDAPPAFDFGPTVAKLNATYAELTLLETRISLTNARTPAETPGRSFSTTTQLVKLLQELRARLSWHRGLTVKAREKTSESSYDYDDDGKRVKVTVPWTCHLPEAKKADLVDALQQEFDELNGAVERINNATMLIEL